MGSAMRCKRSNAVAFLKERGGSERFTYWKWYLWSVCCNFLLLFLMKVKIDSEDGQSQLDRQWANG